ncbi:MAG: ribosomal protein S18-alanine N-acetyltransferase [Halobacteriales archaeon]|nr:ribosomal protein S18-alanine N-acetyltransferase [Halobacteriales archaeon]
MQQVRLRNFRPEDLFPVLRLANRTLSENYEGGLFLHLADLYPDGFIVCEDGERIVGFILGVVERAYEARILILAVDEDYRKRGIGSELVKLFIDRFRRSGIRRVKLEVRISNTPAILLYERLGFERKKVLPGYYADGEDAFLMSRPVG